MLVLVHSTKRKSASLPITDVTKQGHLKSGYHAYKKNPALTNCDDLSHIPYGVDGYKKNALCPFCVVSTKTFLIASVVTGKTQTNDIRLRDTGKLLDTDQLSCRTSAFLWISA